MNSFTIRLSRLACLTAGLGLASGLALGVSLEVSGTPEPAEMVCPRWAPTPPAPSAPRPVTEEEEVPSLEEISEVLDLPKTEPRQRIRLQPGKHADIPSIGIWGDSHLAAAFFTDELITSLGLAKNEVQPGFLPPTMGRPGVRLPIRKHCKSPGWRFANAYVARGEQLKIGPALTVLENTRQDTVLWIDFRTQANRPALSQLTIALREIGEQPVTLEIGIDDGPLQQVTLEPGERQLQLQGREAFSQLRLRILEGSLAIEGFVPTYLDPARLRLDIFGIPGATARSWRVADPAYLRGRLATPDYDLVILEYGTNEGADRNFDAETYRNGLAASLRGMKGAFPNAQCLLIGPTDRGILVRKRAPAETKKKKGARPGVRKTVVSRVELLKYAHVHARIADIQKSLAQDQGCMFWDWQQAMGGPGGAYRWFFKSPPLMAKDLIHLTRPGYQESARLFIDHTGIGEWLK